MREDSQHECMAVGDDNVDGYQDLNWLTVATPLSLDWEASLEHILRHEFPGVIRAYLPWT